MDDSEIHPPHLNSEIYKKQGKGTSTLSYFDYVRVHSDGSILVGCSEMTGRFWNGGANVRNSVGTLQNELSNGAIKLNIQMASGTADGCFVDKSNKVMLCEDSGTVSIWAHTEGAWAQWEEVESVAEHDDGVTAIDCLDNGKLYVTVGLDAHVKVWDIEELICVKNYRAAHSSMISDVSVKHNSKKNFVTCSNDRSVCLWDYGENQSVLNVAESDSGIRCVQWLNENWLIFGDDAGVLSAVDVREPGKSLSLVTFPSSVHRVFIQEGSRRVGVCCDNRIVSVYEISDDNKTNCLYVDNLTHRNNVRGLAWDNVEKNKFHTVAWDGVLATHTFT